MVNLLVNLIANSPKRSRTTVLLALIISVFIGRNSPVYKKGGTSRPVKFPRQVQSWASNDDAKRWMLNPFPKTSDFPAGCLETNPKIRLLLQNSVNGLDFRDRTSQSFVTASWNTRVSSKRKDQPATNNRQSGV